MIRSPGFLSVLQQQLETLPLPVLEAVNRPGGLEVPDLISCLLTPSDHDVFCPPDVDSTVVKRISRHERTPWDTETVAAVVLVEDDVDPAKLQVSLASIPKGCPSWVLVSPRHVDDVHRGDVDVIPHYESFRLNPGNTLRFVDGAADLHPCGSGDLVPAAIEAGVMSEFIRAGGRHIAVVRAGVEFNPALIGHHVTSRTPVTVEVKPRHETDHSVDVLCECLGIPQIVSSFRLTGPPTTLSWTSSGSMVFDAALDFSSLPWRWHRIRRVIDGAIVVEHVRLLQQFTEAFVTSYVTLE